MEIKDLKTGDILLYKSKGFLPSAIRFFTRSHVNHVSVVVSVWGELFVAESGAKGFVLTKIEDSIKKNDITVLRPKYFNVYEEDFLRFVIPMLGKHRYDFLSLLFYQPIYTITKRLWGKGVWLGRKDEKALRRLYCSEAIAYIYNHFYSIMGNWWEYYPGMFLQQEESLFYREQLIR